MQMWMRGLDHGKGVWMLYLQPGLEARFPVAVGAPGI